MATAPPAAPKKKLRDTPSEKFSITRVPSEWLPKGLKISKAASGEWVVGAWGFPRMTPKEMKASGYFQPIASSLRPKGEGNPPTLSVLFFFELCVGASSGATVVIGATTALDNGVNGEGRASTYTNGVLLTITLEAARAALRIGKPAARRRRPLGHSSRQPGESDSCRLIYICWIPLQGQSTAGARRSCIWSHLGKPQTHLHIAPH